MGDFITVALTDDVAAVSEAMTSSLLLTPIHLSNQTHQEEPGLMNILRDILPYVDIVTHRYYLILRNFGTSGFFQ